MKKRRLDVLLAERGLFGSRQRARAAVMAGRVRVDGTVVDKAGTPVREDAEIGVTGDPIPYVSRGGCKLARAVELFGIDFGDRVVADLGASTGGFTQVALQGGARKVYAVDVGYGQLAWELRQDPRVEVRERTNARHLRPEDFLAPPDIVVADLSFISLDRVFPAVSQLLPAGGEMVALVKPQFEAGRDSVGKKGVVRDPAVHQRVLAATIGAARRDGLQLAGLGVSPIRGPRGNAEFLLYLRKGEAPAPALPEEDAWIRRALEEAQEVGQGR